MKYYAGIGSRKTPKDILILMNDISIKLEQKGLILNSGGASGADSAFSSSISEKNKQVFIPWKGFNNISNGICNIPDEAFIIAEELHSYWSRCSQGAKKLHARNIQQILGKDLNSPVEFVVCWTPSAKEIGGTATAIRLAKSKNIKVFNLAKQEHYDLFRKFLDKEYFPEGSLEEF